ncbi:hypothetical protein ACJIZ3_005790 [Penstemon smallii]|uniref:Cornichon n=1 Tax=Penstemon smallii TaxID=265156 RepID=A0ABD3S5V7_9LAMI
MVWEPILWLIFSAMNLTLLVSNFYQFLGFSDLEGDHINPYELSSNVNYVIVPEYLLHAAFSILFLVTGHWIMFLVSLPPALYNLKLYLSQKHLIYVTEVFRVVNAEKKARLLKIGFYVVFFAIVIVRLMFSIVNAVFADDDSIHGFGFA